MKLKQCLVTSTVILASLGSVASAEAEIVYLSSGRTLSVKGHRLEGESIVLTLRNGGEVTVDKSLVDKISGDEVPYPDPEPSPTMLDSASEAFQDAGDVLQATPYGELIASMSEANGV